MIFSLESNTATAPAWVGVLNVAKDWGVPPWDIAGGSKLLWYLRQKTVTQIINERQSQNE